MAYEYEGKLLDYASGSKTYEEYKAMSQELQEVYRKAKAFDEVKGFIIRKLKEEEEEKPRTLLSDYDYGLYQAYDNVDDIIQEHMEDK
ncbi:hypothetical protein [Staphylococcus saprophyticus]|uniref:hypothetical protein n=1 Tax=Staphylococcus saprophyticus TaxID=29385 RepID=UPI000853869B|nr:hypothetical protein [Staphylococcus saprophyticus]MDW4192816.1 hypothetical protein [Staphylococcus saprophyticus]MDW4263746.1 hypothetical protein [Staphylococcus saprophyticus]MDW4308735.1 hypothetical protein [Staphylococcus saprophyticus]MDW4378047.1 hypothetical protein [Staphylococcus saprophyticus]MDW4396926.1 hypothetical protein [Staphylococcus saprophyticus]